MLMMVTMVAIISDCDVIGGDDEVEVISPGEVEELC